MSKKNLVAKAIPTKLVELLSVIGDNCIMARKRRGMTQAQAAEKVFVDVSTIRRMENGDANVSFGTYLTYAFVFGNEDDFGLLFAPERDKLGMLLERHKISAKKRMRKKIEPDLNF